MITKPPSLAGVTVIDLGRRWRQHSDPAATDPRDVEKSSFTDDAVERHQLDSLAIVVLVGAPGVGKTAELLRWFEDVDGGVWVNLAQLDGASSLESRLADGGIAFVDGCDEFDGNPAALLFELARAAERGVRLRISTRDTWWHQHRELASCLGTYTAVALGPLDHAGAAALLADAGHDATLVDRATAWGASELVANPRLLIAWARVTGAHGLTPSTRLELYGQLASLAASELNPSVDRARHALPDGPAARMVAQRCAAVSLLSLRSTVTTNAVANGDRRVAASDIAGSLAVGDLAASVAGFARSSLAAPVEGGFQFVDRSMAEYLAATELVRCVHGDEAEERFVSLLTTAVGRERFVPPALRGVASWTAELDAVAFEVVFQADRTVLLEQPAARFGHVGLARLFDAFLTDNDLLRQGRGRPELLVQCVVTVPHAATRLVGVALDPTAPTDSRRRALEYMANSGLRDFDKVAADIVCDGAAEPLLRYWAGLLVSKTDDAALLRRVFDVVSGSDAPDDPELRVFGMVLAAMWPEHIDLDELLSVLREPTSDGLLEYEYFLSAKLARRMRPEDVAGVLRWVTSMDKVEWQRPLRHRLTLKYVVSGAASALSRDLSAGVRAEIVSAIADHGATVVAETDLESGNALLTALRSDDLITITMRAVRNPDLRLSAMAVIAAWLGRSPAASTELIESLVDTAETTNDEAELARLAAALRVTFDHERDVSLTGRIIGLGTTFDGVLRQPNPSPPQTPPPGLDSAEPAIIHALRELAGGNGDWRSVTYTRLRDHSWDFSGLWSDQVIAAIDRSERARILRSAETLLQNLRPKIEADRDTVTDGDLMWAHAVETVAVLDSPHAAVPWLTAEPLAAVRCERFVRSKGYRDALNDACEGELDRFVAAGTNEITHAAKCAGCQGRADWLTRYPSAVSVPVATTALPLVTDQTIDPTHRIRLFEPVASVLSGHTIDPTAILDSFDRTSHAGQAAVLLYRAGALDLESLLTGHPDIDAARQIVIAIAQANEWADEDEGVSAHSTAMLAVLYREATTLFERASFMNGPVPVEWTIDKLRSACISELTHRGVDGVHALVALAESGSLTELLDDSLLRQIIETQWNPLAPDEVVKILDDHSAVTVHSGDDLKRIVLRGLNAYERSLHGIGGGAHLLREGGRPRQETDLSIDLLRFLKTWFDRQLLIVNREVELLPATDWLSARSTQRPTSGQRADIVVQAVGPDRSYTLIIELKGSWNKQKYSGFRTQLVDRYLAHPDVDAGVHAVFWFDRVTWPESDNRRRDSPLNISTVVAGIERNWPTAHSKPADAAVIDASIRH